eukprot:scaffold6207_cov189-Ochromonas_danica.AAC.4
MTRKIWLPGLEIWDFDLEVPYAMQAAVQWADDYCASNSEWLCAEFVARALHFAGEFPGLRNFANYRGFNLRLATGLYEALIEQGWRVSSPGTYCGEAGQVLIYLNGGALSHAALAIGGCKIDQHNPNRCGSNAYWGESVVLSK